MSDPLLDLTPTGATTPAAANAEDTDTAPAQPTKRVFHYEHLTLDDPDPEASIEEIRAHYASTAFPALATAVVREKTEGDTLHVYFEKRVTTKGAAAADAIALLIEALRAVPRTDVPDPVAAIRRVFSTPVVTLACVHVHADELTEAVSRGHGTSRDMQALVERCQNLPPSPSRRPITGF